VSIKILSFFTGGGFLDLGFERAGFNIIWTNEVNPAFADMYEHGIASWRKATGSTAGIAKISNRRSIADLTARGLVREAFPHGKPPLFGIIGGPPCPDFSFGGRNGGSQGEHGQLTMTFVELTCKIRPHFFLMENVAGLFRTKKHRIFLEEVIGLLEESGFAVDATLLNALELGVPQDRERLFVVGFRRNMLRKLLGANVPPGKRGWYPWPEEPRYVGAKQLQWPTINEFCKPVGKPKNLPMELTVYPLLAGNPGPEALPNGTEFFKAYSPKFQLRAEGDVFNKSFKRLHRYRYSPTAWYGNNEVHLHPWKPRRLSVREALRIQTVPDEYILPPEYSLSAKFKMTCNGVPCLMAEHLGRSISDFLNTESKTAKPHIHANPRAYKTTTNVRQVTAALRKKFRNFSHCNKRNPLDELLFIICSVKTNEEKYQTTYKTLKLSFPRYEMIADASPKEIAKAIEKGGLSNQKSVVIKKIFDAIMSEFGAATLSPLRPMSDGECEKFLLSLPGVGKKTARCVMMYSLGRQVFPVDTHCWRICRRLGWIRRTRPDGSCSPRDMDRLQTKIPDELRLSLHVNLVSLGRQVCTANNPRCSDCPINFWCRRIGVSESG